MDKFKNKYRIPSARLLNWDYGSNGTYFITICTKNREHFFGELSDTAVPTMQLNEVGLLAEQYWLAIPTHFHFVELGNFVVMPNHLHGILIINKIADALQVEMSHVETLHATSLPENYGEPENVNKPMPQISPKSGSLSTIIRSYKSAVTKTARAFHADFEWQARFHDHIVRNADSFETIQNYIADNPANWISDKYYL